MSVPSLSARTRRSLMRRPAVWAATVALAVAGVPAVVAAPAWAGTADVTVVLDDTTSASSVPDGVVTVDVNGTVCTQNCVAAADIDDIVMAAVTMDDPAWVFVGFGTTPVCSVEGTQTSTTCTWTATGPTTVTVKVRPRALTALSLARTPSAGGTVSASQFTDDGYSVSEDCPATSCSLQIDRASSFDLSAQPADGYRFVSWSFIGGSVTPSCTTDPYCTVSTSATALTATATFELIPTTAALTVVRSPLAGGTVSSSPAGISCGATCSASFTLDAPLTLTATPASGYRVKAWSGVYCDEPDVGTTCTLSSGLFEDTTATVTFEQVVTVTVAASFSGEAGGSATIDWENGTTFDSGTCTFPAGPACIIVAAVGDTITLAPAPAAGTAFSAWSGLACAPTGFADGCTVTASTSGTITAGFTVVGLATITVRKTGGAGTVEVLDGFEPLADCTAVALASGPGCQVTVTKGRSIRLEATAEAASAGQRTVVGAWTSCASAGDDQLGSTCVVTPQAAREVSVDFHPVPDGALSVVLSPVVGSLPLGAMVEAFGADGVSCGRTAGDTVASDCSTTGRLHDGVSVFITAPTGWRASATGCELEGDGRCQLYLTAASTVTVTFTPVGVWTVTLVRTNAEAGDSVDWFTGDDAGTCDAASCPVAVTKGDALYIEAWTTTAARQVALTVPAAVGCTVTGTVVDRTCYGTPTGDATVTAAFSTATTRSIGAKVATGQEAGGGVSLPGSPACSGLDSCAARPLTVGSQVTVTATPALGWAFASWTGCPVVTSSPACTFTVAADSATLITASFTNVGTVTVSLSVPSTTHGSGYLDGSTGCSPVGGAISCNVVITKGRSAYVSANFDEGWIPAFAGGCTFTSYDSCTVTATTNTTITLTFVSTPLSTATFTALPASAADLVYRAPGTSAYSEECGSSCSIARRTGTSIESRAGDPTPGYVHLAWTGCAVTEGYVCELPTAATAGGDSAATATFAVAADTALRSLTMTNTSTTTVVLDGMSEYSYEGYDSSVDCFSAKTCTRKVFEGQRLTLRTFGSAVTWTVTGAAVVSGCTASATSCVVTVGGGDVSIGTKNAAPTVTTVQAEGTTKVVATWPKVSVTGAYGSSELRSDDPGASVSYSFTGTSISFFFSKTKASGIAIVKVDGVTKASVNQFSSTTKLKQKITVSGLTNTAHKITITVSATKPTGSTGRTVSVDAFAPKSTTCGTGCAVTPTVVATWSRIALATASGGAYAQSKSKGATLTFSFTGTKIQVFRVRGADKGKVQVYLDGVLKGTLNDYAASTSLTSTGSTFSGLALKAHTVKFVVLRTLGSSTKPLSLNVAIDRAVITS